MPHFRFYCVICGASMKASTDSTDDVTECQACARIVPVPQLASLTGQMTGCAPVFAPEVLDLEVKFLCTSCKNRLRAAARWEGRSVICPVCAEKTRVPRWSNVTRWPRVKEENTPPAREAGTPAVAAVVTLSPEEIEFLSETAPARPAASQARLP